MKPNPPLLRTDGKPLRRYKPKLPPPMELKIYPHEVRAIRQSLGMTQKLFALTFGIPLKALHLWEYGKRGARGTHATLLRVIAHDPGAVVAALARAASQASSERTKNPVAKEPPGPSGRGRTTFKRPP